MASRQSPSRSLKDNEIPDRMRLPHKMVRIPYITTSRNPALVGCPSYFDYSQGWEKDGLGLIRCPSMPSRWSIIHMKSGRRVGCSIPTWDIALEMWNILREGYDWSFHVETSNPYISSEEYADQIPIGLDKFFIRNFERLAENMVLKKITSKRKSSPTGLTRTKKALPKKSKDTPKQKSSSQSKTKPVPMKAPGRNEDLFAIPIPIIGVSGESYSGKTVFGLSINPDPKTTLYYDWEFSGESYESQLPGIQRVSVRDEVAKKLSPNYPSHHLWNWWVKDLEVRTAKSKFKLIVIDPISDLENALEALIRHKPSSFGLSHTQIIKAPGLMWGVMKKTLDNVLKDIASRSKSVFCFTAHMKTKFVGNAPTRERIASGKDILYKMASLYLELRRDHNKDSVCPPRGIVKKSRLGVLKPDNLGNLQVYQVLPDVINPCTPSTIRWYIENPIGTRKLLQEEMEQKKELTDQEKLEMEESILSKRIEVNQLELENQKAKESMLRSKRNVGKKPDLPKSGSKPNEGNRKPNRRSPRLGKRRSDS